MPSALLRFILTHRFAVVGGSAIFFAVSLWTAAHVPLDVVPDISNVQVQVLTAVPNLAPDESETSVTRPIELEMNGLPDLVQTRSVTVFGVSQVVLVFRDGTDPYLARQLVNERLTATVERIPRGLSPRLAPLSTGLGEIFTYALLYRPDAPNRPPTPHARLSALKTLQDFVVRPAVRTVPGLADVNTTGGFDRQFVVEPKIGELAKNGLDLTDLVNALTRNAAPGAGAIVDRGSAVATVRSLVRTQTPEDMGGLTVKLGWGSVPVLLREVATVNPDGARPRTGAATLDGEEAVLGTALMLPGENGREVARRVDAALTEVQRRLPAGVELRPLYDRSTLVDGVLRTVRANLFEGAFLVVLIHLLMLGNWRGALIVVSVIPIAFAASVAGLHALGFSGNLMSLGAIDFGLLVDGAIVAVDNVARRLAARRRELGRPLDAAERHAAIQAGCREVAAPTICGGVIITLVYLPIFGLGGVEGKMFHPLALTAVLALLTALVLSLTLVPALCGMFLREDSAAAQTDGDTGGTTPLMRALDRVYRPILAWAVGPVGRAVLVMGAGILGLFAAWTFTRLGAEFLPRLDEGSLVVEVQRDPTISLDRSVIMEAATEQAILRDVPEITHAFARIGASDIATDPQGPNQNDIYLSYKPRAEWRRAARGRLPTKQELAQRVVDTINKNVPGQELTTNQPIEVRFGELLEGVHADVAVKVFGPDSERLDTLVGKIEEVVKEVPGADEVALEEVGHNDTLEVHPNYEAMRRYLAQGDEINHALGIGYAGQEVGRVDQGETFFPLVVRLSDADRTLPSLLEQLPLRSAEGTLMLALKQVASVETMPRLNRLLHEDGQRRRAVMVNVHGRDVEGFVRAARRAVASAVPLEPGYRIEFGGAFEQLDSTRTRLMSLVPVAALAIVGLVFLALGSWRRTLVVCVAVPLALIGGVFALAVRGMPFIIPAAVGFIAVGGVVTLNSLVLVSRYGQLVRRGVPRAQAASDSARSRLRPVLMTAVAAAVGFIPMALAQGPGAEIQRPLATVVIGGIFSATLLTLALVPALLTPGTKRLGAMWIPGFYFRAGDAVPRERTSA